jgi:hypothetical protein
MCRLCRIVAKQRVKKGVWAGKLRRIEWKPKPVLIEEGEETNEVPKS